MSLMRYAALGFTLALIILVKFIAKTNVSEACGIKVDDSLFFFHISLNGGSYLRMQSCAHININTK